MPSTKVQCQFCNQMFSKRSHLYRHWTLNRCSSNPNPLHKRVRCLHCNGEFASEPNLRLHITRNRCPGFRQQTPPPLPTPQQKEHNNTKITAITTITIHGTSAANIHLPAVVGGNDTEKGVGEQPQPTQSKPSA